MIFWRFGAKAMVGGSGKGGAGRMRRRGFSGSTVSVTSCQRWKSGTGGFFDPPRLAMTRRPASGELVGRNQLPIGISRFGGTRKGPFVGDSLHLVGIALNEIAILVAGRLDHFGIEFDSDAAVLTKFFKY